MKAVNISGEFTGTFAEFKKMFANHPAIVGTSDDKREQWFKDQYAKVKVDEVKPAKKKAGE